MKKRIQKTGIGGFIFDCVNTLILIALALIALYPCWYVLMASVSDPVKLHEGSSLLLLPRDFGLYSYKSVMENTMLWIGYKNTLIYVIAGTLFSVIMTVSAAFCATRKDLPGKNIIMLLIMFTMYFSGGIIPTYMVVRGTGILNTALAMILPNAVNTYNLIITMSYFRSMPESLEEAASIDGAGPFRTFVQILVPLAKPIIAVISLYYAVAIWNDYFHAMIYITDPKLKPLQVVLRQILMQEGGTAATANMAGAETAAYAENIRYATIVVSTVPILCVYPFIQKFFIKGVMIGAVKG